MCGWWTPPRWSAAARVRPPSARRWPGGRPDGYCASHSRWFWGLRLHLVCTLHGLPVEAARAGAGLFRPLRQLIESVNQTFKGQLDLERHGGRTGVGVAVRVLQRILALTAAIWHNDKTGQPTLRSLVASDSQ